MEAESVETKVDKGSAVSKQTGVLSVSTATQQPVKALAGEHSPFCLKAHDVLVLFSLLHFTLHNTELVLLKTCISSSNCATVV